MRRYTWGRAIAATVAIIATLAGSALLGATTDRAQATHDEPPATVNNNARFVQVYANNVENLPKTDYTCPGDWKDLTYYMRTREYSPDLFLVQQVAGDVQLDFLSNYMSERLAGQYDYVVANPSPERMNSPCGERKAFQTNGIIYRIGRFDLVRSSTWQANSHHSYDDKGGCSNNRDQDRTESVRALLYDERADTYLTAASVHWPTDRSDVGGPDGPVCATDNARETDDRITADGYGGRLRIFGGDFNTRDRDKDTDAYKTWYAQANGDLTYHYGYNYRDAIFDDCTERSVGLKDCLRSRWTFQEEDRTNQRRIDFLFAQGPGGSLPFMGAEAAVTFNDADLADKHVTDTDDPDHPEGNYSEHRAIIARIHYP